ncbi:SIR2 family protein [Flavivirga aquimarina]|uniref:SIR2 family protein n=1 Tax=Flavivirga aquimarina TaxID=2027862 RepID=A0ABT8WAY3_9FLAO|nr:SIR2 family protein [Flavivirga aquimarina]MDO5970311.1 SIR2 family protein [Flavivirga aquimarina]
MTQKEFNKKSNESIILLAQALAINYFDSTSIDLLRDQRNPETDDYQNFPKKRKTVFQDYIWDIKGPKGNPEYNPESNEAHRNILVIGAGATKNAFHDIPLGNEAVTKIQEQLSVGTFNIPEGLKLSKELQKKVTNGPNGPEIEISFNQFLKYDDENEKDDLFPILSPILKSEKPHILREIRQKYKNEYDRLKLYSSEKEEHKNGELEFETALNLLSRIFNLSTIRKLVQDIYKFESGITLFYQIVAHLFKNRFIDVIINFNFDELLDEAIDDEIGANGYDRIISDGDVNDFKTLAKEGKLRRPLYIKPHGTASYRSSMRFTKDHYYEIPIDIKTLLSKVFQNVHEKPSKIVNLIIVGFNMDSFEFNEILKTRLPKYSKLFYFQHFHDNDSLKQKEEKTLKLKEKFNRKIFKDLQNRPEYHFIFHQLYRDSYDHIYEEYVNPKFQISRWLEKSCKSLDNTFHLLCLIIQDLFRPEFKPRRLEKHLIISKLLGNERFWKEANKLNKNTLKDKDKKKVILYPKQYFESPKYYRDRVIVELMFELSINKDMIDPSTLMNGLAGKYYSKYFDCFQNKDDTQKLSEIFRLIDPNYILTPLDCKSFEKFKPDTVLNSKIFSNELNQYLENLTPTDKKELADRFSKLRFIENRKIQSNLRSSVHHIFENYEITDLVDNDLSHDLYFSNGLEKKVTDLCIIGDMGIQLLKFLPSIIETKIQYIFIILDDRYVDDFHGNLKKILQSYKKEVRERVTKMINTISLKPLRHNHHMTFFMDYDPSTTFENQSSKVRNAIYFYKKGLSRKINPIRLNEESNKEYLLKKFKQYSDYAKCPDNWITKRNLLKQ